MIRRLHVKNFKSIRDHEIELGRINVFIGENGSGKSNILEAMGFLAAGLEGRCNTEGLYLRGLRVARPEMTLSSYRREVQPKSIHLTVDYLDAAGDAARITRDMAPETPGRWDTDWLDRDIALSPTLAGLKREIALRDRPNKPGERDPAVAASFLADYAIYNPSALALRGLESPSKRVPLGINGENLDVAIYQLDEATREDLLERARCISWLDRFELDPSDELKFKGHKLGRSTSRLYFRDRFMQAKNNLFSAENANEGILHILFHLTLFAHPYTPRVFGIDNIETALNPQLCRSLMVQLAELAARHDKQALLATHNPAVLDGMNLHDDEQRLFVVSRNDDGHTVTRRVKLKPETPEGRFKLSELWMRGHLGGLPEGF